MKKSNIFTINSSVLCRIITRLISRFSSWAQKEWLLILLLFLTSITIRFFYIWKWGDRLNELVISDFRTYNYLAMNLLKNGFYGTNAPWSFRPPLYPFFLSGIYSIFGPNFFLGRFVQSLIASFSIVFLYYITKEIFDKKVAFIAGLFSSFNFTLIIHTGLFGSEILYIFLSLIFFMYFIRAVKYKKVAYFVVSGIFLGLSALCRPTILAFIPFIFCGLLITERTKNLWFFSLIMVFVSFLVIFPWTVRNYLVHKEFVLISTNGGYMFWIGLHPGATGDYHFPEDQSNPLYELRDEVKANKIGYREGMKFIKEYPREFIRLMFIKSHQFWNMVPFGRPKSIKQHFVYVILSIIGVFLSVKRWNNLIFIYFYIVAIWGVHVLVHSGFRYSVPLIPFLCIFASHALVWVYQYYLRNILVQCRAWEK